MDHLPAPIDPNSKRYILDAEHLRLLSIVHYIYGTMQLLYSLFFMIYALFIGFMAASMSSLPRPTSSGAGPSAPFIFAPFAVMGVFILVIALLIGAFAVFTIWSGYEMQRRKRRTLTFVISVINCIGIPFGTALGVCTLLVLGRDSVKVLYEGSNH